MSSWVSFCAQDAWRISLRLFLVVVEDVAGPHVHRLGDLPADGGEHILQHEAAGKRQTDLVDDDVGVARLGPCLLAGHQYENTSNRFLPRRLARYMALSALPTNSSGLPAASGKAARPMLTVT